MIKPWSYKRNKLYFEKLPLLDIAKDLPTPFYLYSQNNIEHYWHEFYGAAKDSQIKSPLVCYALKANPNPSIVKLIKKLGGGADVVSGGELKRAIQCGIKPDKIVFSGVGKTKEEIRYALNLKGKSLFSFNVESIEECKMINKLAKELGKTARIAFRINPKVATKTHKNISTGDKAHKFGVSEEDFLSFYPKVKRLKNISLVGLSIHIGSQLTCLKATKKAIKRLCAVMNSLNNPWEFIDVGGGLGVNYQDQKIPDAHEYMDLVSKVLKKEIPSLLAQKNFQVVFEPGRFLMARSGVLVSQVIRIKESEELKFSIIDAAMNDFLRPSLYSAYHQIAPVIQRKGKKITYDVVGPVCESTDSFANARSLTPLKEEDYLIISDAGAYGASMSSTYNLRELTREYLVDNKGKVKLIKKH